MHSTLSPEQLQSTIDSLENLLEEINRCPRTAEKIKVLNNIPSVRKFLESSEFLKEFLRMTSLENEFRIKSILAIGQEEIIFRHIDEIENVHELLEKMLKALDDVERFYDVIGGIIGYHLQFLKLLASKNQKPSPLPKEISYYMPIGINLSQNTKQIRESIRWGIRSLPELAEIYPVGGSGDRLHFHDEKKGQSLPVAALPFFGNTLLEGLIQDLQAREYLYYKIFSQQLNTPIAMMTSLEKNNHQHIIQLCEKHHWFGRNPDNFKFFIQPLVPVITIEGEWVMEGALHLLLKPGGHGAIWKQAMDNGVFDWLQHNHKRTNALIRQINNPAAGIDSGLLAFTGFGSHYHKVFGFASCQRVLNTAEGMDVMIEKKVDNHFEYKITNVEYTEFEHHYIKDVPENPESCFSKYPANTNILFVNLEAIQPIIKKHPVPGMLINLKNTVSHIDSKGQKRTLPAGRLESTMQNIADYIVNRFPHRLDNISPTDLKSFITYNDRKKTLSVTKKAYEAGASLLETPEGCFYEFLENHYDLLRHHCKMEVPALENQQAFIKKGPSFLASFHPSLGPLYQVISQKIQGGKISQGSELKLEIAELEMHNLNLNGSLLILSNSIMGKTDEKGQIIYSEEAGKCTLHSVTVQNKGINRALNNHYTSYKIHRDEALKITLLGNAEFHAENVTFIGSHEIEVPDGHRMVAWMRGDAIHFRIEKIASPTWYWKYAFNENDEVVLQKTTPLIA